MKKAKQLKVGDPLYTFGDKGVCYAPIKEYSRKIPSGIYASVKADGHSFMANGTKSWLGWAFTSFEEAKPAMIKQLEMQISTLQKRLELTINQTEAYEELPPF